MTPKFLREEALRFRGMAETTAREASKQRLLDMAADYEAQAAAADLGVEKTVKTRKKIVVAVDEED